ncbi:MAG: YceI family protein [Gammaproteobacteria bacterium]
MKTNLIKPTLALVAGLFLSANVFAAPETFTLDPEHTYVLWNIKHLGFSTQAGKWYAKGTLVLDKEHPADSKVNVTIDLIKMITGLPELDKHLKGKQFFDVAKFPKAIFVSDKVNVTGKDTAKVEGTLTLHGISKPVTLDVKLNQEGPNPITTKMTAGFSATATIKRSDFGMTTLIPALGDDVELDIEAEAYQAN